MRVGEIFRPRMRACHVTTSVVRRFVAALGASRTTKPHKQRRKGRPPYLGTLLVVVLWKYVILSPPLVIFVVATMPFPMLRVLSCDVFTCSDFFSSLIVFRPSSKVITDQVSNHVNLIINYTTRHIIGKLRRISFCIKKDDPFQRCLISVAGA